MPDEILNIFRDFVTASVDTRKVADWVSDAPVRQDLFANMAMGVIRWPRVLGRPDGPNLFDGFVFRSKFWQEHWHWTPEGGKTDFASWMPHTPPPIARDGVADPDHYLVRYTVDCVPDVDNQVEIEFASMSWRSTGRSLNRQLYLSSHGFQFHNDGHFVALPDITVDNKPFFHP